MRQVKPARNQNQRKRFSEGKPNPMSLFEYRLSINEPGGYSHHRSTSTGKNKKLRLKTDYEDTDYRKSLQKNYQKAYYSKKRKDTEYFSYKRTVHDTAIHSTKSNQNKNTELRALFNASKHLDSNNRSKPKGHTAHHPLLKFVANKNKEKAHSPYSSQIQRFENLYSKIKKSTSKAKRPPNTSHQANKLQSKEVNLSLNKKEIHIAPKENQQKRQSIEQETVKTIKKKTESEQRVNTSKSKHSDNSDYSDSFGLTQEEEEIFGDRFPYGFQKLKLLGRGGFSLVWLGKHIKSGKQFAIKQIITQNTHQTHIKQIWFGTNFFTLGGIPKPEFSKHLGIKNLARMYSYEINQSDTWIFYEKCGQSLGSNLYDIRAERVYGEQRLYKIFYKPLYESMSKDLSNLKNLIIEICKSLALLSSCEIVHSDLKTENILIKYEKDKQEKFKLHEVKLIDYGSSFEFKNISQFSMATPEYMPPQILNYIIHQNEGDYEEDLYQEVMNNYKNPWVVDIFSLGCVLLEIVVGVPLWMSLPLLVPSKSGASFCQKEGLFAVKGRLFPEIIKKQRNVISRLSEILEKQNYSKIALTPSINLAIKGMLEIDFHQRISPTEVIKILQEDP